MQQDSQDGTLGNVTKPETPLERAARLEALDPEVRQSLDSQREANAVLGGIDDYLKEAPDAADPESAQQLNSWQIPDDPAGDRDDETPSAGTQASDDSLMVQVFSAGSESEAIIVRGVLEAAGIPVTFDNLPAPTLGNVFSVSERAWADIVVPAEYEGAARTAIAEAISAGQREETEIVA